MRNRLRKERNRRARTLLAGKAWMLSEQGLSQREIGKRLHIAQSTVSLIIGNSDRGKVRHNGEAHHRTQLTEDDVREMRRLRRSGMTHKAIAERFPDKITVYGVWSIVNHRTWRHVHDEEDA